MFSSYDPASTFPFPPSDAANLEYSILSTILGNSPDSTSTTVQSHNHSHQRSTLYASQQSPTSPVNGAWPGEPQYRNSTSSNGFNTSAQTAYAEQTLAIQPSETTLTSSSTTAPSNGFVSASNSYQQSASQYTTPRSGPSPAQVQDTQYSEYTAPPQQAQTSPTSLPQYSGQTAQPPLDQLSSPTTQLIQRQPATAPTRSSSATLLDRTHSSGTASWAGPAPSELEPYEGTSVYKAVTKPYDYTEGYHFLMKHLPTRCVTYIVLSTL